MTKTTTDVYGTLPSGTVGTILGESGLTFQGFNAHSDITDCGISKEKFKLWLMVKKERQEETQTYTEGEGEGKGRYKLMQGTELLNCCSFPVPAEKWGEGCCGGSREYWKTCVLDNSEWLMIRDQN